MGPMQHTLFISDLHLDENHRLSAALFHRFMDQYAGQADALYILGDFFEMWTGDDDDSAFHLEIMAKLRGLSERNIPVYFIRGNRDFLIGKRFAKLTGCQLLPEICTITVYGQVVTLTHGDGLCLLDTRHLKFRKLTQNAFLQQLFLMLPLKLRKKIGVKLRKGSQSHTSHLNHSMMDVSSEAVIELLHSQGSRYLVHGHTHQPKVVTFSIDGEAAERIVLGAWEQQGCALKWQVDGTHELVYFS
jgi:UDP-2,3-diacylglucosamine hydrolase